MDQKKISQKDYLKKYLSSGDDAKKKKKKKLKLGSRTVKLIDDDINYTKIQPIEDNEFEIFNDTEDAPQIVGIIDESGAANFSDKKRWKIIANDEDGNIVIRKNENNQKETLESCKKEKEFLQLNKQKINSTNGHSEHSKVISSNLLPAKKSQPEDKKSKKKDSNSSDSNTDSSVPKKSKRKDRKEKRRKKLSFSDSDSDLSLQRKSRSKKKEEKEKCKRKSSSSDFDTDLSPPTKSRSKKKETKRRHKKDSDTSSDSDLSSPRSSKHKRKNDKRRCKQSSSSDTDLSPPRKYKFADKADKKRRKKSSASESDSDLSPPRKSSKKPDFDINLSPERKSKSDTKANTKFRKKSESDLDLSPPRREHYSEIRKYENRYHQSSRSGRDFDKKHDQRSKEFSCNALRQDSDGDLTPPRKSRKRSKSPPKRSRPSRWDNEQSQSLRSPETSKNHNRRMKKTLDGKTAGLQDAKALKEETESYKKRETDLFNKMSAEVSGIGQATILRDRKTGRRRDLAAEALERREKEKKQDELKEKYAQWGKGLKQAEDQAERLKKDLHEMSKPLARYADDADLDRELREQLIEGDPMLEYMKKKLKKEGKLKPERPTYEGSFMPNRFGIRPGHRWDGVDRSNGYEKKWFDSRNSRKALEEEAYKWSTSDM